MRHSEIGLTMQHYTDPKLLDVAGAIESLPSLSLLDTLPSSQTALATGTDNVKSSVAKTVANQTVVSVQNKSIC